MAHNSQNNYATIKKINLQKKKNNANAKTLSNL